MVVGLVGIEGGAVAPQRVGGELAPLLGQSDDLVAGELDGSRLVDVDVAGVSGDDPFPAPQERGDGHGVALGAAHQEIHVRLRLFAGGADLLPGGGAEAVLPVAWLGDQVGLLQPFQDAGMGPLGIVAEIIEHGYSSVLR